MGVCSIHIPGFTDLVAGIEQLRRELPGVGFWLDTSELTVDQTVMEIISALRDPPAGPAWLGE